MLPTTYFILVIKIKMTEEKKPERNGRFANLGIKDHSTNKLQIDTKKNQRSHKVLPDDLIETNQVA